MEQSISEIVSKSFDAALGVAVSSKNKDAVEIILDIFRRGETQLEPNFLLSAYKNILSGTRRHIESRHPDAIRKYFEILLMFVDRGVDVNTFWDEREKLSIVFVLAKACEAEKTIPEYVVEALATLSQKGLDINQSFILTGGNYPSSFGVYANMLSVAVESANVNAVKTIVDFGGKILPPNGSSHNPLERKIYSTSGYQVWCSSNLSKDGAILNASIDENFDKILENLLEKKALDVNMIIRPMERQTLLHVLSANEHYVDMLLRYNADIDARNVRGQTPFDCLMERLHNVFNSSRAKLPQLKLFLENVVIPIARKIRGNKIERRWLIYAFDLACTVAFAQGTIEKNEPPTHAIFSFFNKPEDGDLANEKLTNGGDNSIHRLVSSLLDWRVQRAAKQKKEIFQQIIDHVQNSILYLLVHKGARAEENDAKVSPEKLADEILENNTLHVKIRNAAKDIALQIKAFKEQEQQQQRRRRRHVSKAQGDYSIVPANQNDPANPFYIAPEDRYVPENPLQQQQPSSLSSTASSSSSSTASSSSSSAAPSSSTVPPFPPSAASSSSVPLHNGPAYTLPPNPYGTEHSNLGLSGESGVQLGGFGSGNDKNRGQKRPGSVGTEKQGREKQRKTTDLVKAFLCAAKYGDVSTITQMLSDTHLDLNKDDRLEEGGPTALEYAYKYQHTPVIAALLNHSNN